MERLARLGAWSPERRLRLERGASRGNPEAIGARGGAEARA